MWSAILPAVNRDNVELHFTLDWLTTLKASMRLH